MILHFQSKSPQRVKSSLVSPFHNRDQSSTSSLLNNAQYDSNQLFDPGVKNFIETGFIEDFSNTPIITALGRAVQTKLAINKPGDEYEQEADQIAEQVIRMPEPQRYDHRKLEHIGQLQRLQTKSINSSNTGQAVAPPIVNEVLASPGQTLPTSTQDFMESRFGHDFSSVRVHADSRAAESARAVNAYAYAVGKDIVFGQGQFVPDGFDGQRLIAHELTHILQQTSREVSGIQHDEKPWIVGAPKTQHGKMLIQRAWVTGRDRSRQSRPRNAPRGTRPIDETEFGREDIHKIKDWVGADAQDWVGITPEGDVITNDEEGNAENHGPATNALKSSYPEIPNWVWPIMLAVGIVALIALIACFASGVCEFVAVVGGLGSASALLILGLLKSIGIRDSGGSQGTNSEA